MTALQRIRSTAWLGLAVLVMQLCVAGVAAASPWMLADGAVAVRCGGPRPGSDDGADRRLDCPLCLPLQAALIPDVPLVPVAASCGDRHPRHASPGDTQPTAALPPARGPPAL